MLKKTVFLPNYLFTSDFRFRVEEDWNSRKSDGSYRENRTRLRYRGRFGFRYMLNQHGTFGMRLRTGLQNKQQDPQLTIGLEREEFSTLPIGLEKLYYQGSFKDFEIVLGKNSFPFEKNNELFWSDNVYPSGISLRKDLEYSRVSFGLIAAHYILQSSGTSLDKDEYFQGFQFTSSFLNQKLLIFPSFYYFHSLPDIPDVPRNSTLDYAILHVGSKVNLPTKLPVSIDADYYNNINKTHHKVVTSEFIGQDQGFTIGLGIGELKKQGDWMIKPTYCYIQKYAIVDFLAQNDWARWDYSNIGSPDGRLSNMQGIEVVGAYAIDKNILLIMKYYQVQQLVSSGISTETGSRIRLDLDVKF